MNETKELIKQTLLYCRILRGLPEAWTVQTALEKAGIPWDDEAEDLTREVQSDLDYAGIPGDKYGRPL